MSKLSPMLQQYTEIKEQYEDCILFFRLGDFYEMFYDDAITASQVLEITLTKKTVGGGRDRAPLCGVPYHSAESYIARLIENGYKVAICEQIGDPRLARGIVKREVVRVVTPGTVTGDTMLKAGENSYLACVCRADDDCGVAWCDISTGELCVAVLDGKDVDSVLESELARIDANEVLYVDRDFTEEELRAGRRAFEKSFGLGTAGLAADCAAAVALYGLFSYVEKTQKQQLAYMRPPEIRNRTDHMLLDRASIRSLELTETLFDRQTKGSLLGVLDRTHTAMGGRLLKRWLKEPLTDIREVARRLDAVEALTDDVLARNNIKEFLKAVYDIERLAGRVSYGNANARDLIALLRSLEAIPEIKSELESLAPSCHPGGASREASEARDPAAEGIPDAQNVIPAQAGIHHRQDDQPLLMDLSSRMDDFAEARALIAAAIVDDPPFTVREGGLIRDGFCEELDALKDSISGGRKWIAELEGRERARTGIKTLKVGYNRVFGYYIDITNANKDLVPPDYIRKQTLVNSERYITPEMKDIESSVLGAEARINELEYNIFNRLRLDLQVHIPALQSTAGAIAAIDALASFAEVSSKYGYVKPQVDNGEVIEIVRGRHPVIERTLTETVFVPNDVYIDRSERSLLLITGPNMAGKSTYMRQAALIVLMAQAGCFVPAERARIGAVDRLYTRIGAADNLARGESTFFVEMNELSYILNTASERSLVILDEIGRGTSTYDGLAIAWAVCDYLCGGAGRSGAADEPAQAGFSVAGRRVRTMFATHYHELTALEGTLEGLKNLNTETCDTGDDVVFLHRIAEGPASRSYGIHVARLAGVPAALLEDAQEKLDRLEAGRAAQDTVLGGITTADATPRHSGGTSRQASDARNPVAEGTPARTDTPAPSAPARTDTPAPSAPAQISMFAWAPNPIVERLKALDLMEITPSQAIAILEDLKKAADKEP
jgi:DNA mismatch repair protein MutS